MRDTDLLKKLKKDPEAGMRLLMDQYAPLIYALVRGKMQPSVFDSMDVEGCVADTFSEFYCSLDRYNPACGSIRSFLCTIAKRNTVDCLRRYYRDAQMRVLDDGRMEAAEEWSLEGDFEDRNLRMSLMQAIRDLGEPDHEILVRKFYLGQSSEEIAARLGLTVSNVDTRTHRAIRKLREQLGGDC